MAFSSSNPPVGLEENAAVYKMRYRSIRTENPGRPGERSKKTNQWGLTVVPGGKEKGGYSN